MSSGTPLIPSKTCTAGAAPMPLVVTSTPQDLYGITIFPRTKAGSLQAVRMSSKGGNSTSRAYILAVSNLPNSMEFYACYDVTRTDPSQISYTQTLPEGFPFSLWVRIADSVYAPVSSTIIPDDSYTPTAFMIKKGSGGSSSNNAVLQACAATSGLKYLLTDADGNAPVMGDSNTFSSVFFHGPDGTAQAADLSVITAEQYNMFATKCPSSICGDPAVLPNYCSDQNDQVQKVNGQWTCTASGGGGNFSCEGCTSKTCDVGPDGTFPLQQCTENGCVPCGCSCTSDTDCTKKGSDCRCDPDGSGKCIGKCENDPQCEGTTPSTIPWNYIGAAAILIFVGMLVYEAWLYRSATKEAESLGANPFV